MEKISFVIPCYRSQNTIEKVVDDIYQVMDEHKEYETEIVLVNQLRIDTGLDSGVAENSDIALESCKSV